MQKFEINNSYHKYVYLEPKLDIYDEDFLRKQNSVRLLQKGHKNAHVRLGPKIGLFMRPAG